MPWARAMSSSGIALSGMPMIVVKTVAASDARSASFLTLSSLPAGRPMIGLAEEAKNSKHRRSTIGLLSLNITTSLKEVRGRC